LRPPTFQFGDLLIFGDAINGEYRPDYNTDFFVFLAIENKGLISEKASRRE
jgi:hypothetical protein